MSRQRRHPQRMVGAWRAALEWGKDGKKRGEKRRARALERRLIRVELAELERERD